MHPDDTTVGAFPEIERWLPVPGWPDFDVSDWGRVRSYLLRGNHDACLKRQAEGLTPHIRKLSPSGTGHLNVRLTRWRDGRPERRNFGVHRLVLMAFVGPCPEGMEACHAPDPDPRNNRLNNLRWDTATENSRDVLRYGRHHSSRLTEAEVRDIWSRLVEGRETVAEIAKRHEVRWRVVNEIKAGKTWTHFTAMLPGKMAIRRWYISEQTEDEIRRLAADGWRKHDIGPS
jgi:hypothetical protein